MKSSIDFLADIGLISTINIRSPANFFCDVSADHKTADNNAC